MDWIMRTSVIVTTDATVDQAPIRKSSACSQLAEDAARRGRVGDRRGDVALLDSPCACDEDATHSRVQLSTHSRVPSSLED
jgi:hypothetical protein